MGKFRYNDYNIGAVCAGKRPPTPGFRSSVPICAQLTGIRNSVTSPALQVLVMIWSRREGTVSNVIIIQNAEKQNETLTFWEFAKIGVPLMVVQVAVYWIWLSVI